MELNTIRLDYNTLQLLPPLSLRIKDGLPRLILDRLPGNEELFSKGWLRIEDGEGEFLSWGFVDISNNAVHLLSTSEKDPFVDLIKRFGIALKKRADMKLLAGEVVRLANSAGDNLSGFTLDAYGKTVILSLESKAMERLVDTIFGDVILPLQPEEVILKVREKRPQLKGKIKQKTLMGKSLIDKIWVKESGLSYLVQPTGKLDTGLFFDLRCARKEFALKTKDCGVLNLFSYTGAFSLAAAHAGARRIVSVEIDSVNQNWAQQNFRKNGIDAKDPKYLFVKDDVFHYIEKLVNRLEVFERIILDPPSQVQVGTGRFFLKSDLPKLIASCLNLLTPKGRLLVTDNTMTGTEKKLEQMIDKGSEIANVRCSIVKKFQPEPDFPVNPLWPKGRGVIVMEVARV